MSKYWKHHGADESLAADIDVDVNYPKRGMKTILPESVEDYLVTG